jgi:hypothetical protein
VDALVVTFVLIKNLVRATPLASLVTTLLITLGFYGLWVKNGRSAVSQMWRPRSKATVWSSS